MKTIYTLILALLLAVPMTAQQGRVLKPLREKSKEFYLAHHARDAGQMNQDHGASA